MTMYFQKESSCTKFEEIKSNEKKKETITVSDELQMCKSLI